MSKKIILISSATAIVVIGLILFLVLFNSTREKKTGPKEKYVAAKSGLNLRSDPGKSSKIISGIPFGEMVTVEKSEGDEIFLDGSYGRWVNAKFGDQTGWVFSGFLCDFKPDTIIKPVADFYRDKYRKHEHFSKYEAYTDFKDSEVSIKTIIDNYIILRIPTSSVIDMEPSNGDVVWKYDVKQKKFFEAYFENGRNIILFHLDDDRYPDLLVDSSCCSNMNVDFFLGSKNRFTKIPEFSGICNEEYSYYTVGSCGDTEVACNERNYAGKTDQPDVGVISHYRFNCNKRKFEKYAENNIIDLDGSITSIDWRNMSIVIRDKKDLKGTSYKFSDRYKPNNMAFSHTEVESLKKKLQKGKNVSFSYAVIEGKKIILGIGLKDVR